MSASASTDNAVFDLCLCVHEHVTNLLTRNVPRITKYLG
jgi:hypothetical protein